MEKYWEDSKALKVSTRELKGQVLSPDESSVCSVRTRGRREVRKGKSCPRRDKEQNEVLSENVGGAGEGMPSTQGRS